MTDLVRLDELFEMEYGNSLELVRMEPCDAPAGVNFVSRTDKNNGVSGRVSLPEGVEAFPAGTITVALGGSVLATFVQLEDHVQGRDIMVLIPKVAMTVEEKLFYCQCIRANRDRYAYGRQANKTLPALLVPAQVPDWVQEFDVGRGLDPKVDRLPFTSEVLASLPAPKTWSDHGFDEFFDESEPMLDREVVLPDASTWGSFRLDELFQIHKGERIVASSQESGAIAYVGGSRFDNGVTERFDIEPSWPAGAVTVSYNGSVGFATVQPESFHASDDVNVFIERKPMSDAVKFFVCTLIRQEAVRFCYGRKWTLVTMKSTTIRLPITASGEPDWDLIESYMMTLRWSQALTR